MIQNRRDLGGTRTADGRVVRPGMLVRSAHLACARAEDLDGISSVIDLRTPGECREQPDSVYGKEYLAIPVFDDITAGISHEHGADSQIIPEMASLYRRVVTECTDSFRKVILAIIRHDFDTGAVLWHCTEGKDRCGLTAAMVLEALGVDRGTIFEDYLKTNEVNLPKAREMREHLYATHGGAFADAVYQAYIADASYLEAAWDAMGKDYLTLQLGLSEEELEGFRERVLTHSAAQGTGREEGS